MHRRAASPILVAGILAAPDALSSAGLSVVVAQSQGPDETHGIAAHAQRTIALTSSQKRAIYVTVSHQRLHASVANIPLVVGAPVPSATPLLVLPDEAAGAVEAAQFLKYAMVDGNVVLGDSINMRVIDIIHGGAGPQITRHEGHIGAASAAQWRLNYKEWLFNPRAKPARSLPGSLPRSSDKPARKPRQRFRLKCRPKRPSPSRRRSRPVRRAPLNMATRSSPSTFAAISERLSVPRDCFTRIRGICPAWNSCSTASRRYYSAQICAMTTPPFSSI